MIRQVIIRLQIEGIHCWEDCSIDDVMFLKQQHRHLFYIELRKEVSHNDRDIEIILLKREVKNYLGKEPVIFGSKSCEMIAEELLNKFDAVSVSVLEDNENGAIITKV